jgi:RecB family exonuclease
MVSIGYNAVSKAQIAALENKVEHRKRGIKIFNDTSLVPTTTKRWRPKATEATQASTKIEGETLAT